MGVFLSYHFLARLSAGLPHARGGVSATQANQLTFRASSPRPWGCFSPSPATTMIPSVFPTPVGVFLGTRSRCWQAPRLPHARGGVSKRALLDALKSGSSPRPWGCFFLTSVCIFSRSVFPTPVGVFLRRDWLLDSEFGLPHARGGVSAGGPRSGQQISSSPRPWGCFFSGSKSRSSSAVFPTPVGVFLKAWLERHG